MQLPGGKLVLITERGTLDSRKVIGVARRATTERLGFDQVAELLE